MDPISGISAGASEHLKMAQERINAAKAKLGAFDVNRVTEVKPMDIRPTEAMNPAQETARVQASDFGNLLKGVVEQADAKGKVAAEEVRSVMTGESNNLHQAVIAQQEAGVAFNLLLETRNKLMEGYKELMRMQF